MRQRVTTQADGLITRARKAAGISQHELAARLGIAGQSVSRVETNPNPSVDVLARYGQAMGYTLVLYYEDSADPENAVIT